MSTTYLVGDATCPFGYGPKIIAHVCNDKGLWGKGFVLAVSAKWPMAERAYLNWQKQEYTADGTPRPKPDLALGSTQLVGVERDLWVANMIGQHDIVAKDGVPPVRYDAIQTALLSVARYAKLFDASVHLPHIGSGLAGGDWNKIRRIINKTLRDVPVCIYRYTDKASISFVPKLKK